MLLRALRIATIGIALLAGTPGFARADDAPAVVGAAVPEPLMTGLGQHALRVEDMKKRGAFTFTARMESLDGDGKVDESTEMAMRSTPTGPHDRVVKWTKFVEDGKDKTAEQQKKSDERREKRKKEGETKKKSDFVLPFLPSEQGRYLFSVVERDAAQPGRVRIGFNPKEPAEDAIKGSAWVDEKDKEVLSVGFSFSKNPTFVDHIDVTIMFGLATPLGRAPSQLSFDGRGGFLFVHKHYRGSATITDPKLAF